MSLEDIYIGVCESMESKKSELGSLLEDITELSAERREISVPRKKRR